MPWGHFTNSGATRGGWETFFLSFLFWAGGIASAAFSPLYFPFWLAWAQAQLSELGQAGRAHWGCALGAATATHLLPPPFFLIFFFRLLGRVTLLLLRLLVEDIVAFEEG